MLESDFDRYSENSVHFFSRRVPGLLARCLRRIGPGTRLVDVGCGDGHLVWALAENRLLPPGSRITGVDLSPIRLRRFTALTGFESVLADGDRVPAIDSASVDLAISTMVIEHVPDDAAHARELARMLRPGGLLYLSTVIRKRGAWYFRKALDGRRVLDPTHLREYPSEGVVIGMLQAAGLVVRERRLARLVFPIAHPLARWLHARRPIRDVQRLFLRPPASWLEWLALPIPRYRAIEIVAQRPEAPDFRALEDKK